MSAVGLVLLVVRLGLGLQGGGHERVVLGAQVQLVDLAAEGLPVGLAGVGRGELVVALERADVADRHVELVRDPGVGSSLPDPCSDLVQLRL